MAEVSLHPAAEADYEAALAWYLARSPMAATGFEAAVEKAIEAVQDFPEAYPLRDDQHRHCPLRRYPYALVYRVDGDRVRVVAVPHNRQMPRDWSDRD